MILFRIYLEIAKLSCRLLFKCQNVILTRNQKGNVFKIYVLFFKFSKPVI